MQTISMRCAVETIYMKCPILFSDYKKNNKKKCNPFAIYLISPMCSEYQQAHFLELLGSIDSFLVSVLCSQWNWGSSNECP